MQTSFQDTIKQLYITSRTPNSSKGDLNYLSDVSLSDVLKWFESPTRLAPFPDITKEDIKLVAEFSFRLLNSPRNLRGILRVLPSIEYLVVTFLNIANAEPTHKQMVLYIIREFYNALDERCKGNMGHIYREKPQDQDSELMYFHFKSYKDEFWKGDVCCPIYRAYGYKFHLFIRRYEKENNVMVLESTGVTSQDNTYKPHVRSLRKFFELMPPKIRKMPCHDQNIPPEYIESYKEGLNKDYGGTDSDPADRTVDYLVFFKTMIAGRTIKRRGFEFHNTRQDLNPSPGKSYDNKDIDNSNGRLNLDDILEIPVDQLSEIEPNHNIFSQTIHNKIWSDLIHLRNYHFFWDTPQMSLFHYSVLYDAMDQAWDGSTRPDTNRNNVIILFIYLCIHTGIDPKRMIQLELSSKDSKSDSIELCMDNDEYYILIPSIVDRLEIEFEDIYAVTLDKIAIPLPSKIHKALKTILTTHGYVFTIRNVPDPNSGVEKEIYNKLTLSHVKEFLKKRVNDSLRYSRYAPIITLDNISSSFIPLYSSRFGLDPIICCHISGEDKHRLYRSQMHYVHISRTELEKKYLEAFKEVDSSILHNRDNIPGLEENMRLTNLKYSFILNTDKYFPLAPKKNSAGYGSSCILPSTYLLNVISKLIDIIQKEHDIIRNYNLMTIYTYLALQFSIGLRGTKISAMTWKHFSSELGTIIVNDKESSKFYEERCLPLPPLVLNLLLKQLSMLQDVEDHIYHNHIISYQKSKENIIFFWINENGVISNFTLNKAYGFLKSFGLYLEFPHNMPRHYLKNYLHHAGVSNDIADTWAGHQHEGKEILNITSSTIPEDVTSVCLPIIERMIRELGFIYIN